MSLALDGDAASAARCEALEKAGHPVVLITLRDALDVAEEFFCWEFATATVGALLGIDPFDEPNVQESKDNTKRILAGTGNGKIEAQGSQPTDETALAELIASVKPGDYVDFAAFIQQTPQRDEVLQAMRVTRARCNQSGDNAWLRSALPSFHWAVAQRRPKHRRLFATRRW